MLLSFIDRMMDSISQGFWIFLVILRKHGIESAVAIFNVKCVFWLLLLGLKLCFKLLLNLTFNLHHSTLQRHYNVIAFNLGLHFRNRYESPSSSISTLFQYVVVSLKNWMYSNVKTSVIYMLPSLACVATVVVCVCVFYTQSLLFCDVTYNEPWTYCDI